MRLMSLYLSLKSRLLLRFEQEMLVLRYILFCRPSIKTLVVFTLRVSILMVSFLVFHSILVSFIFIQNIWLNLFLLAFFLWIMANFLWEFGYTIRHVKRFGMWLCLLLLLPLPLYFLVYADTSGNRVRQASFSTTSSQSQLVGSSGDTVVKVSMNPLNMNLVEKSGVGSADVPFAFIGKPLNFPNPFVASEGTVIGFALTKPGDLEIHIYNMLGMLVGKKIISEDSCAGFATGGLFEGHPYFKIPVGEQDIRGPFSAGGYFYLIIHDGQVLSKGKMAVLPG